LRSKNKAKKKNRKGKPAYRRGEKLAIYLKRGTIVLIAVVIVSSLVLGIKLLTRQFSLDEIIVTGNYHLEKEDIVRSMELKKGNPMLDIRSSEINDRLRKNPWIKSVALKKQLPGTLLIKVKEAAPRALLSIKKKLYIIDEDGRILERIKGESTPFLPVIKEISPKNKRDVKEALKLISSLTEKNMLNSMESVEIGTETYGLFVKMDGEIIKVGYGGYSEKFERWLELEPEIRQRGIPIKYIDLRFKDSVIVKPGKKAAKGKSS
jgi:cell division protein FtsQ